MKTIDKEALKNPSPTVISLAKSVFRAMAYEKTVRSIVENYQKDILQDMQAHNRYEPEKIILDPNQSYLMVDDDFQEYLILCNLEQAKANLYTEKEDYCPLLVAEELTRKAKQALIDALEPVTGISLDKLLCAGLDKYKEYIDLNLSWLVQFVA